MTPLPAPELEWDDDGVLRSGSFGDIYFSPDDGLAESHFNFVGGNDLPARMTADPAAPLQIGELGFGTGLNLIALLAARDGVHHGPLKLWSVEGFPLDPASFAAAQERNAKRWPDIAPYAEQLARAYPEPHEGEVSFSLPGSVEITLAFGPVQERLKAASFQADAWFLDGFAPSKNPDMWSTEVFTEVARLTAPAGTAATFSVASGVRGALEQAGFSWEKATGFGRKRHMLKARLV